MNENAITRATGSTVAFIWFISLFIVALCVATVALSASQLQSRLQALSNSNAPYTVWQVERIRGEWGTGKKRVKDQRDQVDNLYDLMTKLQNDVEAIKIDLEAMQSILRGSIKTLAYKLALYEPLLVPADIETLKDDEIRARLGDVVMKLEGKLTPLNWQAVQELDQKIETSLEKTSNLDRDLAKATSMATDARNDLERVEAMLKASTEALAKIVDPDNRLDDKEEARLHDLISEFDFIEAFALGALHGFSVLPSDFLIIILVVTMGVLGSTMQLTYDYYRTERLTSPSLFVLRPMLGAITALVVFILLRAGVLVVTDTTTPGETAPLNPFFIAFVGIVSGLLSENALEMVRRVGSSWFASSGVDKEARWAAGVAGNLSATKTSATLAARTGLDEAEIEAWIEQAKPTPPDMQKMFAAWLDKDVQTLFTDMPPRPA